VVDAVQCAVATPKGTKARNTELPENRKMQFRIGVNLGDVIGEESRIYGDGVNIAAGLIHRRPGGICISKTDLTNRDKLPFGYAYLGSRRSRNAKPWEPTKSFMEPRVKRREVQAQGGGARRRMRLSAWPALVIIGRCGLWQFLSGPQHHP